MLAGLPGQWIEACVAVDGSVSVITSGGWVLRAPSIRVGRRDVVAGETALLGARIAGARLGGGRADGASGAAGNAEGKGEGEGEGEGTMTWDLAPSRGPERQPLGVYAPWTLDALRGARLSAAPGVGVNVRAETGPRFATREALRAWRDRPVSEVDLALLALADDDWLSPADVLSELVRRGGGGYEGAAERRSQPGAEADEALLQIGIDTLAGLVARRDLVVGCIGEHGFESSAECTADAVERLATTWSALGARGVLPGSIGWFDITPEGREHLRTRHPAYSSCMSSASGPSAADPTVAGPVAAASPSDLLVVIDPQRIFADPASAWASPFFPAAMERITALATAIGPERTVLTRWLPTGDRATAWGDYFRAWPFADIPADDPMYELVDEAAALTSRPTIGAPTFGKWGAELADVVADATGAGAGGRMILTGVATDCCVISTALAAADAGVHVLVVRDACGASTAENGAAALQVMALYGPMIEVVDAAEVLAGIPAV